MITFLAIFLAAQVAAGSSIKISFDPVPEPDLPVEARHFKPAHSVYEDHDVHVLHGDADRIKVRYFSPKRFKDAAQVETYLTNLLALRKGITTQFPHWAEGLGVPTIEALTFKSNVPITKHGRLLIWPGRAACEDLDGNWWFTSWQFDDRLLTK